MPEIDRDAGIAPWKQIADDLRAGLADGTYRTGRRLPSITELAADYGVARTTALKALRKIEEEGLARMEPGLGFYVTGRMPE